MVLCECAHTRRLSVSASTLSQCCDDSMDICQIERMEIKGVAAEWGCNPFCSDSVVFNEITITSAIAALTLTLGINWS